MTGMTPVALVLVLAAAAAHATWNLLVKRAGGGAAFVWLSGVGLMVVGNAATRGLERRRSAARPHPSRDRRAASPTRPVDLTGSASHDV